MNLKSKFKSIQPVSPIWAQKEESKWDDSSVSSDDENAGSNKRIYFTANNTFNAKVNVYTTHICIKIWILNI